MSLNMMERPPSFEYLCRVCAANTKGKNSVPECVSILKTPALKDKIEKFLYLSISDEDILPKVLCKACFRQVEATASLSKIAKHTQKVFRDFISNTIPSAHALHEDRSRENEPIVTATVTDFRPTILTAQVSAPAPSIISEPLPQAPQPISTVSESSKPHEDVVVNVSVSDPLTRETQHKMISASQRRNASMDSRFTPKSIAQRAFTSTPKQQENNTLIKKPSPPGVINFFRPQQQQQQQVTAYSGGYVIGRSDSQPSNASNSTNISSAASNLQQKRRNLKMALNNIKSMNSGQVSLLKVSQKPSQKTVAATDSTAMPPPTPAVDKNIGLHDDDESHVTELPERMIIAATKNQKQRSIASKPLPESPTAPIDMSQPQKQNLPDDILLGKVIKDSDLLRLILKALKWPVTKQTLEQQIQCLKNSRFSQIMSDPNLLQDTDLTQIMAPYLAPVSHASQILQQQHQKQMASTAAVATGQPNLPIIPHVSETQNVAVATGIPYKLPAETSVQLVPASTDEDTSEKSSDSTIKRNARSQHFKTPPRKLRRVNQRERATAIVISDEETGESTNDTRTSQSSMNPSFSAQFRNNNALLLAQSTSFPGNSTMSTEAEFNEAIYALLERQRAAFNRAKRAERRKRSNSTVTPVGSVSDLAFDADDIVLMEPDHPEITPPQDKESNPTVTSSSIEGNESLFAVPKQVQKPLITRPIIKRRKTVIQTSTPKDSAATVQVEKAVPNEEASLVTSSATMTKLAAHDFDDSRVLPPMPPLQKKPSPNAENSMITLYSASHPASHIATTQAKDVVAKATETLVTAMATIPTTTNVTANAVMSLTDSQPVRNKKQQTSKAALGQQLLEAIGLQKTTSDDKLNQKGELNPRESVEQIRSALKKSLQEAQKQSARKQEEPIKQDADSTTKNLIKEIVVEPRRRICSLENVVLDVEQEINKITLVLQSKAKADAKQEEGRNTKLTEKSTARKPGIRRKIVPSTREGKMAAIYVEDEEGELKAIEQLNELSVSKTQDKIGDKLSDTTKCEKSENERLASTRASPPKAETLTSETVGAKRGRKPKKRADSPKPTVRSASQTDKVRRRSVSSPRKIVTEREEKETEKADEQKDNTTSVATEKTSPLRPTRVSKTMSKYYIGPCNTGMARRGILTRSTRKRN